MSKARKQKLRKKFDRKTSYYKQHQPRATPVLTPEMTLLTGFAQMGFQDWTGDKVLNDLVTAVDTSQVTETDAHIDASAAKFCQAMYVYMVNTDQQVMLKRSPIVIANVAGYVIDEITADKTRHSPIRQLCVGATLD